MNTIGEQDIFIRLPLAVRIRVYRYLLIGAHTLVTNSWKRVHETYPRDTELRDQSDNSHIEDYKWPTSLDNTILRTSRQTHAEASAILFRESAFQVTYHISDLNRGLEDLDIGDLEANLHRILHLTINIVEADDEPEDQPALQLEGSHSQLEEIADKETKKTEKKTRGIALLFERYAARCTALRRLTVCFEFEEARRRPRDPQSRWRPMLELVLRNEAILRALASLAVRDQVVIKTNVKTEPFYTKEINGFVSLIAGLKGWESKSESSGGLDTEEGPIDKWVLLPKIRESLEQNRSRLYDNFAREVSKRIKTLHEGDRTMPKIRESSEQNRYDNFAREVSKRIKTLHEGDRTI